MLGSLVLYDHNAQSVLGVVVGENRQRWKIFNMRGREVELEGPRLFFLGSAPFKLAEGSAERTKVVLDFFESAQALSRELDLPALWEQLVATPRQYSTADLCSEYYGKGAGARELLATRLAFLAEKVHFKRDGDGFCPRAPEAVAELKRVEDLQRRKDAVIADFMAWAREHPSTRAKTPPAQCASLLDQLQDCAIESPRFEQKASTEVQYILTQLAAPLKAEQLANEKGAPQPKRCLQLLRILGLLDANTNLAWWKYRPRTSYAHLQEEVRRLQQHRSDAATLPDRKDLRALEVYTVDDPSTRDMDDGLSFEWLAEGGYRLGVHISDVASLLPEGSALEHETLVRGTSVYVPEGTLNMLPPELSESLFSLLQGVDRPAVTVFFNFSGDYSLQSSEVLLSLIRVRKNLSYDEVDELIEQDHPFWGTLARVCMAQEERRFSCGGRRIAKREIHPVLQYSAESPERQIIGVALKEIDEEAPSRALVAETAVLCNECVARFAVENSFPLVFRSQEEPTEAARTEHIPIGPARDFVERGGLKKSLNTTRPGKHATLGLAYYAQVTSPIRRCFDLYNQRQLVHFLLHRHARYTAERLTEIIEKVEPALGLALSFSKESRRFWLLKYFDSHCLNSLVTGIVVRNDLRFPLVEVEPIYSILMVKTDKKLPLGQSVKLRVSAVDPQQDFVRLDLQQAG